MSDFDLDVQKTRATTASMSSPQITSKSLCTPGCLSGPLACSTKPCTGGCSFSK